MEYRLTVTQLKRVLASWDALFPGRGKLHLIACGGTALSLLGYKESTKDVDFLVPIEKEYERLVRFLARAGYEPVTSHGWQRPDEVFQYDIYRRKKIFQTELLESPLNENGHKWIWEGKKIYLGALNSVDLIISKLFRGEGQDIKDCLALLEHEPVNLQVLEQRYRETAKYEIAQERVIKNLERFLAIVGGANR